jgi:hypothetical protein
LLESFDLQMQWRIFLFQLLEVSRSTSIHSQCSDGLQSLPSFGFGFYKDIWPSLGIFASKQVWPYASAQ